MDDAWQSQDMAPSAIAIPPPPEVQMGSNIAPTSTETPLARRSSRSRSPAGRVEGGDRGREVGGNPGNNLHVSGLSTKIDNRDLEATFAKVGRVQKVQVMYDPHTRESRGFGFVTMETPEEADAAITALNSTELFGKVVTVEKARRGRARTPTPGRYYGPPKRNDYVDRRYDPKPYDSRYYDNRFNDRNVRYRDRDRDYPRREYDEYRGRHDRDRDRERDRGGFERRDYGYGYDRRYDDRRY